MSHGVKLISLSVQDVGPLTGRIDLGPFSSGLNVISGRNEVGKSTLVAALRAALFERHDVKHQRIKALQTHGTRNAPEIWVDLDIGGERITVHKRFLEKPRIEVRLPGGGAPLVGDEGEDLLLARLAGRRAGRQGGTKHDMGLWGLLWVTQDETAYSDPGEKLDDSVRGALSDMVSRQVGQVLGGRRSEQVRTRALEHAGQFFTRRSNNTKTGKYKEAEERRAAADERVKKIEQAVAEVEDLAAQHAALAEQLLEKNRLLPALKAEHEAAITAERRVQALAGVAREAESRLATVEAELEAVQKDVAARALLADEAAKLDDELKQSDGAIGELERTLEGLTTMARDARERAAEARSVASAAREAVDAETARLDQARRRREATRLCQALAKADEAAGELDEAVRQKASEAMDERTFEQLESLAGRAATLRAQRDAEGTRIIVYPPEGNPVVRSVSCASRIVVPELGALEIEPAQPGLAQAVVDAGKKRAKFEEALTSLGVTDVQAARDRHAARAEAEGEAQTLGARKQELAPSGLEALEQKVLATRADRARLEAALDEAAKADHLREECARELASNRVNEEAIQGLRDKEQGVAVLRAASDAMGTQVEIVALADLRLRTGSATVPDVVVAGRNVPLTVTQATTVLLEGVAELRFEPRGEDLAKSRATLARAESELGASLAALGVRTMKEATEAARGWARLDEARKRAEDRLKEAAPRGIPALRAEVEKVRMRSGGLEDALAEAKRVFARHARLEIDLAQERVTREALARLERSERDPRDCEAEVKKRCARVRAVEGPVARGAVREWEVSQPMRPEAVAGIVWEILPGELGGGLDVEGLEQRIRDLLTSAGVADLGAAKERYKVGLKLSEQIAAHGRHLRSLAPDGIEALRAQVAALGGVVEPASERGEVDGDEEVADLEATVKQREAQHRAAQASAEAAAEAADLAERSREAHLGSLREVRGERKTRMERREGVAEKLAAGREVETDADLSARLADARCARDKARESARKAAADLNEATPRLLEGEEARAAGALASWRKSVSLLNDESLRLKTLLNKAAVEGRFEELAEARAEQAEAAEALARIEREAGAARLLAHVVEEAYADSQRLFLAPVLKEAAPYLTRLRPGTELRMTRELRLDKVVRRGAEENFDQLSGGTREQLSVIVRLALARVMAMDNRPLPLILDDTMGWTDDRRFLSMVQILRDASSELQIILLTCHPSRFERFQAEYSEDLDRLKQARPPAVDLDAFASQGVI